MTLTTRIAGALARASLPGISLLAALVLGCGGAPNADDLTREETREIMEQIFGAMHVLLPVSVDLERFSGQEDREELKEALGSLTANTQALESHVSGQDLSFSYLARNVAADASAARRAFEDERYERSAFLLGRITENCIVCHSRLPSPGDSPLAEQFVEGDALAGLPYERRAALQIATRRFDAALATFEELFASNESPALLFGPLTDYLVVSIRVKGELERPARTLRKMLSRKDLWRQLRGDITSWIEALGEVGADLRRRPTLEGARSLFHAGLREEAVPGSHAGLVQLIAASAVLERYTISVAKPGPDLAEGYFLLGVIEARIGRNYWVSQAPFFLESSIRMAPQQPFAREAYAVLERELLLEYEGTDEEELPQDDLERLAALKSLIGD